MKLFVLCVYAKPSEATTRIDLNELASIYKRITARVKISKYRKIRDLTTKTRESETQQQLYSHPHQIFSAMIFSLSINSPLLFINVIAI